MSEANVVQALRYIATGYHSFNETLSWYDSSTTEEERAAITDESQVGVVFFFFTPFYASITFPVLIIWDCLKLTVHNPAF